NVLLLACTHGTLTWFEEVLALLVEKTKFLAPVAYHMHQGFPDSVGDLVSWS
ncbi:hypothetical protein Tco_1481150, partial [Tanacetum coccineum]